jgi:hypothetical protein
MWWQSMDRRPFPLAQIDKKALAELQLRVPDFPKVAFRAAVSRYLHMRDDPDPTPASMRDELDTLVEKAMVLGYALASKSGSLRNYLHKREKSYGAPGLSDRLATDLMSFMEIAEVARRDAETFARPGVAVSPRTELIRDLSTALRAVDLPVSAKAQDRLTLTFCIALRAAGEQPLSDPARTVKSALATIEAKQRAR